MAPKRVRLVLATEQPPLLQDGDHMVHEVVEVVIRRSGVVEAIRSKTPSGMAELAAFEVDEHGQALSGTQALSTCGWAFGRTIFPESRSRRWLVSPRPRTTVVGALVAAGGRRGPHNGVLVRGRGRWCPHPYEARPGGGRVQGRHGQPVNGMLESNMLSTNTKCSWSDGALA